MWQAIIVILIGLLAAGYLGYRLVRLFAARHRPPSSCKGCCGCALGEKKDR
jgi:hypothetical protein